MCTGTHPFIPAENVLQARLFYTTVAGVAENVLNFQLDHTPILDDLDTLAEDIIDWWGTNIAPQTNEQTALNRVVITDLTVDNSFQVESTLGLPISGTSAGSGLPDNVTLAIKHTTTHRGRSYRGRTYMVGIPAFALDDNDSVNSGYASALTAAYDALATDRFEDHAETFVIVSYCQDNAWLTDAVVTPVVGNFADLDIDSMRRRLKGRGM